MKPVQRFLVYALFLLCYAAMLGVPGEKLQAAALTLAWVSAAGLAIDVLSV